MNKVTTNYNEATKIEKYLYENNLNIVRFFGLPKTIENGVTTLDTINIDPNTVGAMGLMFKKIELVIRYTTFEYTKDGQDHRHTILTLDYNYTHPGGGSNGHSVRVEAVDGADMMKTEEVL